MLVVVVLTIAALQGCNALMWQDWFPKDFETCLTDRSKNSDPKEVPAFSIQYTCINYHLARQNIDKDVIKGLSEKDKKYLKHLGRKFQRMEWTYKRRKRSTTYVHRKRKEIRTMTDSDRKAYFDAVNALKKDGSYDAITNLHQHTAIPGAHFGCGFLGWHRIFLIIFQLAIWEKNPNVVIPYCDTRLDFNMQNPGPLNTILFSEKFYGNCRGRVVVGDFSNWDTPAGVTLQRNCGQQGILMTDEGYKRTMTYKHTSDICTRQGPGHLESQHNGPHMWTGGLMGDLYYSPCDPFFFCHHNFIDYVWHQFRKHQKKDYTDVDPGNDYPFTTDNWHKPNASMAMLKEFLNISLIQKHGYHDMFDDIHMIDWEDSPSYPNCGNGPYIIKNDTSKTCHSAAANPMEQSKVSMLQRMRSSGSNRVFEGKMSFQSPKHDSRTPAGHKITKRAAKKGTKKNRRNTAPSSNVTPLDLNIENDFKIDNKVSAKSWCYFPIRIVYERSPKAHFDIFSAKYQRVAEEIVQHKEEETLTQTDFDIYDPKAYPKLRRKIKQGHTGRFRKQPISASGAYKIMTETVGFSYIGKHFEYSIVDARQPIAETVAYVAVKRPIGEETVKAFVTAYDPDGRVCEARCRISGTNPTRYEKCSGVISLNNTEPKMYANSLGGAYLMRYRFQGDDLPSNHDDDLFLLFFCNYGNGYPWSGAY